MRSAIDTEVLVAGLRSRTGVSRILLETGYFGVVLPLVSVATFLEYEAVLTMTEQLIAMRHARADIDAFLNVCVAKAKEVAPYSNHGGIVRDPDDDKFVSAAINGNAEAVETFNIRDYVLRDSRVVALGVLVCRPGDLLRRMSWRPPATSPFGFPEGWPNDKP